MSGKLGFAERRAQVGALIDNRHKLALAYRAALQLADDYPNRAESYYLLNLVTCLGNLGGGPRGAQQLVDRARQCADHTLVLEGDMQRDRIIGLMRHNRNELGFALAERLTQEAERCHAGDYNRLACLTGVTGRVAFARKLYKDAVRLHAGADRQWQTIGEQANATWVYFNLIQWLRALVAIDGPRSERVRKLAERIVRDVPPGERNRINEARVLTAPFGLRLYRLAEKHRG